MTVDMMDLVTNPTVKDLVTQATRTIYRRYRKWVTRDDLNQEQWLWICANPGKAQALHDESHTWLLRRLRTVAERHARKEKAAKSGYEPDDEYFYSLEAIAELLPDALDPTSTAPVKGITDMPGSRREVWQEWETSVADIRAQLPHVPPTWRDRLAYEYEQGIGHDPAILKDTLRLLQRRLGGSKPKG